MPHTDPALPCAADLIGGHWTEPERTIDVTDPATGRVVGTVSVGGAAQATAAADAAAAAFESWSTTTHRSRGDLLRRAGELLRERRVGIGMLLAREAGKRLPEALGEVDFAAEYLLWFGEEARRPMGEVFPAEAPGRRHFTISRPAGVVLSLTPWNFPVSIQARKVAAMLAAGCTVVARVSEKAPLAATEFFRALTDAGVPDGVLNLVHGPSRELTTALLDHPSVRVVSFTGSSAIGQAIMAAAATRVVRPVMELGGNAPFIVFDDADLTAATDAAVLAKTRNTGQSCVGANRFYVHENVLHEFSSRFAEALDGLSIGPGVGERAEDPVADLGPLIDQGAVLSVTALVETALESGGTLLTRDREVPAGGAFMAPALVAVSDGDADLACHEVFGPAAAVMPFRNESQALSLANATELGLAAYVFSANGARAWRMAEGLEAGIVGINDPLPSVAFAPMGGVKQSGLGREGAADGLRAFQDTRYISWRE